MPTESTEEAAGGASTISLQRPTAEDGKRVHALVRECQPLDENSLYCNLLQCTHFSATSIAAVAEGALVGFISGYIRPDQPDTLFIWQVAVSKRARGCGLGKRMLASLLKRPETADVRYVETTITPDNDASWGLFRSFTRQHNTSAQESVLFESHRHFGGKHKDEHLLRIGPLGHLQK